MLCYKLVSCYIVVSCFVKNLLSTIIHAPLAKLFIFRHSQHLPTGDQFYKTLQNICQICNYCVSFAVQIIFYPINIVIYFILWLWAIQTEEDQLGAG